MAIDWKDKIVAKPRTYTLQANGDGTTTLVPAFGTVTQAGSPLNAANMKTLASIEEACVYGTITSANTSTVAITTTSRLTAAMVTTVGTRIQVYNAIAQKGAHADNGFSISINGGTAYPVVRTDGTTAKLKNMVGLCTFMYGVGGGFFNMEASQPALMNKSIVSIRPSIDTVTFETLTVSDGTTSSIYTLADYYNPYNIVMMLDRPTTYTFTYSYGGSTWSTTQLISGGLASHVDIIVPITGDIATLTSGYVASENKFYLYVKSSRSVYIPATINAAKPLEVFLVGGGGGSKDVSSAYTKIQGGCGGLTKTYKGIAGTVDWANANEAYKRDGVGLTLWGAASIVIGSGGLAAIYNSLIDYEKGGASSITIGGTTLTAGGGNTTTGGSGGGGNGDDYYTVAQYASAKGGNGGSDGANGTAGYGGAAGGTGQGHTTKAFGEASQQLFSPGGRGGYSDDYEFGTTGAGRSGDNSGAGGIAAIGGLSPGSSGICVLRWSL